MKRIIMIAFLSCLTVACEPSAEIKADGSAEVVALAPIRQPAVVTVEAPAEAGVAVATASVDVAGEPLVQYLELYERWPSGTELQKKAEGFMDSGFMKNQSQFGFADLAYGDMALDCTTDGQGKISQLDGVFSGLYESYSFVIPVVQRRVDAISGSRQVNREDVIVQLEDGRWFIQPVSLKGGLPFEVGIDSGIEFISGDMVTRIVKTGSVFTCTETYVNEDGQEKPLVSWEIDQYGIGPVRKILSVVTRTAGVPVVLSWEPGSIAGYIASLPEGQAQFAQRLRWEPTGKLEADRGNFLVLLTQRHGAALDIDANLGTIDPVWLALLMYDHVVNP